MVETEYLIGRVTKSIFDQVDATSHSSDVWLMEMRRPVSENGGVRRLKVCSRRGMVLVYATIIYVALVMFVSLGVDFGRVQAAKMALQTVAYAAARAGAWGLSDSTYFAKASAVAAANLVDGVSYTLGVGDVTVGNWNGTAYVVNKTPINAIRVSVQRTKANGNAIPTVFAQLGGNTSLDIHAFSTACYTASTSSNDSIGANSSVWYTDLANGTHISDPYGYDTVGVDSYAQSPSVSITPGTVMNFSATGSVTYSIYGGAYNGPEGDGNTAGLESSALQNGMSDFNGPGGSLIGVFLDNSVSGTNTPPAVIDYSTTAALNYTMASPLLRQVFFIGSGTGTNGLRNVIVPNGATRLILGYADSWIWRDNGGSFAVNSNVNAYVKTVQIK